MPELAANASIANKANLAEGASDQMAKSGNSLRPTGKRRAAGVDVQVWRVVRRCLRRSVGSS
jgi:hypothetical protein